jgi:hypothetical protein
LVAAVSLWFLILAIPVGLLLIAGIIVLVVYLSWVLELSIRELVIKNKKITVAMSSARDLIHHNFTNVILAWLIQAAVSLVAGIGMLIVAVIVGGLLFGIGAGIYFAGGSLGAIIYGSIAGIIFIALILLLGGIINAYISTYWTIVYRNLAKVS